MDGARDLAVVDEFDGGAGWVADPDGAMRRTSHLLVDDGGVWVVEPVDAPGLDDLLEEYGPVLGVVVLLDRHARDSAAVAARHGVAVHRPVGVTRAFDAPTTPLLGELGDSGYRVGTAVDLPGWHESVLWDGETLVVPEAVGTTDVFTVGDEVLGVQPVIRLLPPRRLLAYGPDRVLCGHGAGVFADATAALEDAVLSARRTAPRALAGLARAMLGSLR
ncbi:MAG: hypothetical protein ABEJ42_02915 [Halobacteriaceae archaeon]